MKIACFSDTHTKHGNWYNKLDKKVKSEFDEADMLLCTGDITNIGHYTDVVSFFAWYSKRPNKYKVLIVGNHDFFFDTDDIPNNRHHIPRTEEDISDILESFPDIIYLNNSSVTIEGYKIWGSPISKWFHDWAFNRREGDDIKRYWDLIPDDTDILMTHGPAHRILDLCPQGDKLVHLGDKDLLEAVNRVNPLLFCFGHIHEGYGIEISEKTIYVNGSSMDGIYKPRNPPIFVELENKDEYSN